MAERTQSIHTQALPVSRDSADASTARFELPATAFALADLFERVPDARVDIEPAIANTTDHALLVVRADESERGAVETSLQSDDGIAGAEFLAARENGWAYRVTWAERPSRLVRRLVAEDITILSLQGGRGRWKLRLLASDRAGISRAHERLADLGCRPECLRVSTVGDGRWDRSMLTDSQREALLGAFEAGYYDIPRDVTANELAEQLGISHQALSERFRRAYRRLVEDEFAVEESSA